MTVGRPQPRRVHINDRRGNHWPEEIIFVQSNGEYFFLKLSAMAFCSLQSTFRGRLHLRGSSSRRFPIISPAKYLVNAVRNSQGLSDWYQPWKIPAPLFALIHAFFRLLCGVCALDNVSVPLLSFVIELYHEVWEVRDHGPPESAGPSRKVD